MIAVDADVRLLNVATNMVMVLDATADFSREEHILAATYAAKRCGAVVTTEEVALALERKAVAAGAVR